MCDYILALIYESGQKVWLGQQSARSERPYW